MKRHTMAAGCALAVAACARAAEEPTTPAVPVVEVVGHYDNGVGRFDAASAGTVTAALIAARPALRTGELLEFVPGLAVTQHSGDGKANQYFLRGFNLDHGTDFATYVDGMPVNMRSHAHGQGYTDLNFLIPELVQRIDYRKGPYTAADGDFASAGSARIGIMDSLPQGIASATVGEHGYRRALLADSTGSLLYGLDVQRNDGPWTVPEDVRRISGLLRWSGGDRENGYHVTAMAYRNRWNGTDQIPLRAVDAIGRFGSLDPTDGGRASRYSVSYARYANLSGGRLEINAYAVRSMLDLYSNFTYALDRPDEGDQFRQSERRTMAGFDTSWAWQQKVGGVELRNKAGVQVRADRLAPVGLYETVARRTSATVREDRVRETSAGIFLESAQQWTPWLRTVAGLRGDAYRFNVTGKGSDDAAIVLPKLSVIMGPWRDTEFFVNAGHGFHSNDARGVVDGVTPLVRTRGVEAGMRTEAIAGLQMSLTAWHLASGSELVYVGDAGTTEPSRASRRRGIEWNNHYTNGPLQVDLDLAVSRARYSEFAPEGDRVPGALERMASFGVTYAPAGQPWSAGFNLRHFGPRPLIEDNSVRSNGTTLAYARIGYRFSPRLQVTLDGFNLFDRAVSDIDYFYESRLPGEAQAREDVHFHPAEPRTFRLTLAYAF